MQYNTHNARKGGKEATTMATNVVAAVKLHVSKAAKAGTTTPKTPAAWAAECGFSGSAASPLRKHLARDSGNGVGRTGRYNALSAKDMLAAINDADLFAEKQQEGVRTRIGKRIKPQAAGTAQAKAQAKKRTVQRKAERTAKTAA